MKTIFAAAVASLALAAGAAHASEATHNGAAVRSAAVQSVEQNQAGAFGGLSIDRTAGTTQVKAGDPARSANSGN